MLFGNQISENCKETRILANAVSILFIGITDALQELFVLGKDGALETSGIMMLIASLASGAVIGEWIDLEKRIERFGEWIKRKSGNAGDAGFVNAFVTAWHTDKGQREVEREHSICFIVPRLRREYESFSVNTN